MFQLVVALLHHELHVSMALSSPCFLLLALRGRPLELKHTEACQGQESSHGLLRPWPRRMDAQGKKRAECQLRRRGRGRNARRPAAPAQPSAHLQEDGVGHGGVGMDDDGGCLVVPDLLEEWGGVPSVIQHPDRERVLGDQELPEQLLEV